MRGARLTGPALERIDRWVAQEGVECLYFLADPDDPDTSSLAEAAGFRLVDVRLTLERRGGGAIHEPAGGTATVLVRPAAPTDVPELRRIAAASHHDSRFYHDPHFDRARCDELYATWIENSCGDPDGVVLVAAAPGADVGAAAAAAGRPCGYIAATLAAGGEGRLGLLAVTGAAQGQGVGGRLIAAALEWLASRGAGTVSLVTQGRNLRAQRIFQRFGMVTRSRELWYHRWSSR